MKKKNSEKKEANKTKFLKKERILQKRAQQLKQESSQEN